MEFKIIINVLTTIHVLSFAFVLSVIRILFLVIFDNAFNYSDEWNKKMNSLRKKVRFIGKEKNS